jgi:hypothetical protein
MNFPSDWKNEWMNTLSFQILIHLGNKLEAECDENIYSIPGPVGL